MCAPHPGGLQQEVSSAMARKKGTNSYLHLLVVYRRGRTHFQGVQSSLMTTRHHFSSLAPTEGKTRGPSPHSKKPSAPATLPASLFPALHVFGVTPDQQGAPVCFPCHGPDVRRPPFPLAPALLGLICQVRRGSLEAYVQSALLTGCSTLAASTLD